MRYTNAYPLFHELIKRNLLQGFCNRAGWREHGWESNLSRIDYWAKEPEYLNIWVKSTIQDFVDKFSDFYSERYGVFSIDGNDNIYFGIDCVLDLRESIPEVPIIRDLIRILVKELSLEKYDDGDGSEEYDYHLGLVLEFEDIEKRVYRFNNFEFRSYHLDPALKSEVNRAIEVQMAVKGIKNIQKMLIDYFIRLHEANVDLPYSGIFLSIIDRGNMNAMYQFLGKKIQSHSNFSAYLKNI
jgi:hypothetical protein